MIDVLIPTYGRPDRLPAVVANVLDNTVPTALVWLIYERDDHPTVAEVNRLAAGNQRVRPCVNRGPANYAGAINTAHRASTHPWLFAGADDLNFHPNWDGKAFYAADHRRVVGTQDMLNPYVQAGTHATHYLVARTYLDELGGVIDGGPGSFLNEGYDHQYTDTEFIATARHRGEFRPCLEAVVEHLHWSAGRMEHDATADRAYRNEPADQALFESRRHLWGGL